MSVYLDPEKVEQQGRRIINVQHSHYEAVSSKVQRDEELVLRLDNGMFKTCPVIHWKEDFDHFYTQYAQGFLLKFEIWAIKRDAVKGMISSGS